MCFPQATRRKTAPVTLTLYEGLACKGLFHKFFSPGFIFVFDILQTKKGLLFFANAACLRVGDETIVSSILAFRPLKNLAGLFIKPPLIEGLIGVECGCICVFSNRLRLFIGNRLGFGICYESIGMGLVVGNKIVDAPTGSEHQSLEFR